MDKAVILFGHGSRDPAWRQPIEAVAARLTQRHPQLGVACAYLELEQPDLGAAVAALVAAGAREVSVVPMFLGTGKHAREDLPRLLQALQTAHPAIGLRLQPPIGEQSRVIDLLAEVAADSLL